MAQDNLDRLREARARLVADRMNMALRLNNPANKVENIVPTLASIQSGIDAIDQAIKDEEANQPSVYESRGLLGV